MDKEFPLEIVRRLKNIDGRYFLFGSHITLFWVALAEYGLPRTQVQFMSAYVTAVVLELFLHYKLKKYPNATWHDRALSAVAEAAGIMLLVRSSSWYFYAFCSAIAVLSKYAFVRHDGVHMFNPTNFAIIFCLAVLPIHYFQIYPDEYSLRVYPIIHVIIIGTLAVAYGRTLSVVLGYFVGLVCWGLVAEIFTTGGFVRAVYPEIGAFGMIFAFLMITDPKTTPASVPLKFLFGAAVGVMVLVLRTGRISYPNFVALFIVSILTYFLSFKYPVIFRKIKKTKDPVLTDPLVVRETA